MEEYEFGNAERGIVEAIDEGRIVRVSEQYAKKEGLIILRKPEIKMEEVAEKDDKELRIGFDDLRKPLDWRKQQVVNRLIDNFHWLILRERRRRYLSRKKFASLTGISESEIKMIENGILPKNGFVLINKIQDFLGINLRKDKQDLSQPVRKMLDEKRVEGGKAKEKKIEEIDDILGEGIEIEED